MKPLNLIALLLFLGGAVWAITQSNRAVREVQDLYYSAMSPFLKSGSKMETQAREFLKETRHSKELEVEPSRRSFVDGSAHIRRANPVGDDLPVGIRL